MTAPMFLIDLLHTAVWLAALVVLFVPLEHWFAVHPRQMLRKQTGLDLCYYFINSLLPAAILSFPASLLGWGALHVLPTGMLHFVASQPFWVKALLGLLAGETGYYWGHRWSHQIPFLWRFHAVHHSAEEMDFLVNTRAHPLDIVFSRFCGLVPMCALGLAGPSSALSATAVPVVVMLIGTTWSFFVHANLRWSFGPLEWVIATPKFHHWHHTKTGAINRNYSSTFPWLDRVFGTHHLPQEWPEAYGIEAGFPAGLMDQLCYPFVPEEAAALESAEPTQSEQIVDSGGGALLDAETP